MLSGEQALESAYEQIPHVLCMVLFTPLHEYFCKCFLAVLRNDGFELCGSKSCFAINLQGNPESSHFLHGINRSIHLDLRDCKPDDGNNDEEFQSSSVRLFPA